MTTSEKFILATAIAAAIGLPSIAVGQTAPVDGSINCRPAKAGEKPNANIQNTQLVCNPVNGNSIPDATTAPQPYASPDQKAKKQSTRGASPYGPYPYPGFDGNPND